MIRVAKNFVKRAAKEVYRYRAARNVEDIQLVFLIATMRSGSTLLMHILGDNDRIEAVGENYISYEQPSDLTDLIAKVAYLNRLVSIRGKYYVDKILHNRLDARLSLFDRHGVRRLFLLRRPDSVIRSLQAGKEKFPHTDTVADSCDYYVNRLKRIRQHLEYCNSSNATFVTYEELTKDTRSSLKRLSSFLSLERPLREKYQTHWYTGVAGIGDPSDRIKAGRVQKSSKRSHPKIEIPNLDRCRQLYKEVLEMCRTQLFVRQKST